MADAAAQRDTIIVDDPDAPSRRRQPRPSEPKPLMHVMLDGTWHRRTPDLATTGCGQPIPTQYAPLRREALADPLCTACFTPFELRKAAERNQGDD